MVVHRRDKKLAGADVPFPAVVGQEALKGALLAVGANDALDGLLIRGEKGTAKSTATRAMAELLPPQRAVADCPYGCPPDDPAAQCESCRERTGPPVETRPAPFVTLPLGASRERVAGALSVADALDGEREFNPGLLARANRGVLYVDEVNLLDDHLVDVLLDAAASGVNRVERDGVSVTHPAAFTLVGTMNPEEGQLRPQFRDRFGLQATVEGADDVGERVAVIDRALSGFDGDYEAETAAVRERLRAARERLPAVTLPESLAREIAELCREAGVEGHRADIATARAARTLAALDGRERVVETDVRRAAELALPHRLQSRPFEDAPDPSAVVDDHFDGDDAGDGDPPDAGGDRSDAEEGNGDEDGGDSRDGEEPREGDGEGGVGPDGTDPGDDGDDADGGGDADGERGGDSERGGDPEPRAPPSQSASGADGGSGSEPRADEPGDGDGDGDDGAAPVVPGQSRPETVAPGEAAAPDLGAPDAEAAGSGRAGAGAGSRGRGARVRTERAGPGDSVDAAASVRAAGARGSDHVESRDLRRSVRAGGADALVVFAVDASASMRGPMRAAKGVALDLLREAYECRDEVAVVTFAGEGADVVVPPTDSVDLAARHLKSLPTGDRTPLPAGLRTAGEVIARADPDAGLAVVVTDGRANAGDAPTAETRAAAAALAERDAGVLVVDAGDGEGPSLVPDVVDATDGERVPLAALTPDRVAGTLRRTADGEG